MKPIKLNIGCGVWLVKGYINIDNAYDEKDIRSKKGQFKNAKIEAGAKYVKADVRKLPFPNNYADIAEMHQVLEHLPMRDIVPALKEIHRVLKPKGKLLIDVPSFNGIIIEWLRYQTKRFSDVNEYIYMAEPIFGNQMYSGEFHLCPFTPDFLDWCITQAGFTKGKIATVGIGNRVDKFGLMKAEKNKVLRNETLYAEIEK